REAGAAPAHLAPTLALRDGREGGFPPSRTLPGEPAAPVRGRNLSIAESSRGPGGRPWRGSASLTGGRILVYPGLDAVGRHCLHSTELPTGSRGPVRA